MKTLLLAVTLEVLYWIIIGAIGAVVYLSLSGCSVFKPDPFPIGNGKSVESIKIEQHEGSKSVYRVERWA